MMTQFEKAIQQGPITCDICNGIMHPMHGGGWDNDRIVCADRDCGAEIIYPTSTEVDNAHISGDSPLNGIVVAAEVPL